MPVPNVVTHHTIDLQNEINLNVSLGRAKMCLYSKVQLPKGYKGTR
jgi:hypothetical protein